MNMPAKEKRRIATKSDCTNKGVPGRIEEELDQGDDLEEQRQGEGSPCGNLREDRKRGIANQTSSNTVHCILIDS